MNTLEYNMRRLLADLTKEEFNCLQKVMINNIIDTLRESSADARNEFLEKFVCESQPISDNSNMN